MPVRAREICMVERKSFTYDTLHFSQLKPEEEILARRPALRLPDIIHELQGMPMIVRKTS